jgi:predicted nucleic acid-binding protein
MLTSDKGASVIVVDSTVLIALAKLHRLQLLTALYGPVLIGPIVKAEVIDRGKATSTPDVAAVEQAVEDNRVQIVRLTQKERRLYERILRTTRLDEGESEAIALASTRGLTLIVDDKEARHTAAALGVRFLGTAGVLLEAFINKQMTHSELEDAIMDLAGIIWLSPTVVSAVLKRAREIKK